LGIPIVCTIHYLCEPIDRFWGHNPDPEIVVQEKALFQGVNSLITVSESMRAIAQDTHGVPDWQISVIHNGIDVESFLGTGVSSEDLSRLKSAIAPHNEKIVLYAGRLHPHKGMKELLDSASLVVRRESNVRYVVAGDPDSPFYARQFQQKLDSDPLLKTKMLVLGKLTRRRLAALYSIANVSVVPSLYDPFPYAAIESMAAGVPVVAGDCGGLAEAIVHGQSGLLVPVRVTEGGVHCMDVQSLAASVSMLLNQEDMARELARTARARVQEKFTLDQMTHSTREIYRRTLARFCKTAA
jgi:glycosyltransferase involved in cell wall biosynthesis